MILREDPTCVSSSFELFRCEENRVLQDVYLLLLNDFGGKLIALQHGTGNSCLTCLLAGLLPRWLVGALPSYRAVNLAGWVAWLAG